MLGSTNFTSRPAVLLTPTIPIEIIITHLNCKGSIETKEKNDKEKKNEKNVSNENLKKRIVTTKT